MMRCIGAVVLLAFGLAPFSSLAEEPELDVPAVFLTGLAAPVAVDNPGDGPLTVVLDGQPIFEGRVREGQLLAEVLRPDSGSAQLELRRAGLTLDAISVPVIPAWTSLIPPVLAIFLAFWWRSVLPALFTGVMAGAWAISGLKLETLWRAPFEAMGVYILNALADPDRLAIIMFTMTIGGMVGVVSRNGGMRGIVNLALSVARTPRRGQSVVALLGLTIFFDDYSNTLIVGNATRPMSDHLRISREKLAYLVDSTAAPVASIAVITTWVGFQVGLIKESIADIEGIEQAAYSLFLSSIPYSFYPLLALFLVFLVVASGRDFGPMYQAERRARLTGKVAESHGTGAASREIEDMEKKEGIPSRAINGVLPILALIMGVVFGLYLDGEGDTLQDIIGSANSYRVLIWASLLASLVAAVLSLGQRLLTLEETVEAWVVGAKFMVTGLILLLMAWAIADICSELQTADYLISILRDGLSPQMLPAVVFILAAVTGFASGSSWAVMGILMPLVVPLAWAVMESNGMANAEHMHILYSCLACVLTGAVWSDHCSPISDTTLLSSLATGCDHMDHVSTQLPYAMLTGTLALSICTLPVGFGAPWWLMLLLATALLSGIYLYLARPVEL